MTHRGTLEDLQDAFEMQSNAYRRGVRVGIELAASIVLRRGQQVGGAIDPAITAEAIKSARPD